MPLFLAEHNWKKEKTPAVMKAATTTYMEVATGVRPKGMPETVCLCAK